MHPSLPSCLCIVVENAISETDTKIQVSKELIVILYNRNKYVVVYTNCLLYHSIILSLIHLPSDFFWGQVFHARNARFVLKWCKTRQQPLSPSLCIEHLFRDQHPCSTIKIKLIPCLCVLCRVISYILTRYIHLHCTSQLCYQLLQSKRIKRQSENAISYVKINFISYQKYLYVRIGNIVQIDNFLVDNIYKQPYCMRFNLFDLVMYHCYCVPRVDSINFYDQRQGA